MFTLKFLFKRGDHPVVAIRHKLTEEGPSLIFEMKAIPRIGEYIFLPLSYTTDGVVGRQANKWKVGSVVYAPEESDIDATLVLVQWEE